MKAKQAGIREKENRLESLRQVSGRCNMVFFNRHGIVAPALSAIGAKEIGGKALQFLDMEKKAMPVPGSAAVMTDLYTAQVEKLGLQPLIDMVMEEHDPALRRKLLGRIRAAFLESSLDKPLLHQIASATLDRWGSVAVRSSAVCEDSDTAAVPGFFDTFLNVRSISNLEQAITACWASLWTEKAFDYLKRHNQQPGSFSMGVLINQMIDAKSSGVVLTCNLVNGRAEIIIETLPGLGEGVNHGIAVDRITCDPNTKQTAVVCAEERTTKLVPDPAGGIQEQELSDSEKSTPALRQDQLTELLDTLGRLAGNWQDPEDIEWCFDQSGRLYILQRRPVTTANLPLPPFVPPVHGIQWKVIDHFVRPNTRCCGDYYYQPMENGWNEAARETGLPTYFLIREVNSFMYYSQVPADGISGEPSMQIEKDTMYWEHKQYLLDLHRWDTQVRPEAELRLSRLQEKNRSCLSNEELKVHLQDCFFAAKEMVFLHHRFTFSAFIPLGDFISQAGDWTGAQPLEIVSLFGGCGGLAAACGGTESREKLIEAFKSDPIAFNALSKAVDHPEAAADCLEEIRSRGEIFREGFDQILKDWGYRIIEGYDICADTYIERLDLVLKAVRAIVMQAGQDSDDKAHLLNEFRRRVPSEKRACFDQLYAAAAQTGRLRNERGLYTDLWAAGILRHAYLEAGRRLRDRYVLPNAFLALDASLDELTGLLDNKPTVSVRELKQRQAYRHSFCVSHVPKVLGEGLGEPPEPPCDIRTRTLRALFTAISLAVDSSAVTSHPGELRGLTASRGQVEARVCVVSNGEFHRVQQGDILVLPQATSTISPLMPVLGGIIAEYGGISSHPAIAAREQHLPCIVGCSGALEKLQDGMRVRLEATAGTVTILSDPETMRACIRELECDYNKALKGRNRDRVYNSLPQVKEHLQLVKEARQDQTLMSILRRHFCGEIDAPEAAEHFLSRLAASRNDPSAAGNESIMTRFATRNGIEFHPTDACNLSCAGCTYHHDDPQLKPPAKAFPFDGTGKILDIFKPRAVTIVGGGEPTLYTSQGRKLGDLITSFGKGEFGPPPALGLITNGVLLPPGNPDWHSHVQWLRVSLDWSCRESYFAAKKRDYFDSVLANIRHYLRETSIPQVGVGFLIQPNKLREVAPLIELFNNILRSECADEIHRFNIQFRPWRSPIGRPGITEHVITNSDVETIFSDLDLRMKRNPDLRKFARGHTNIASNLLSRGAREQAEEFSECFIGLTKAVVRANGDLFPCFRMAADFEPHFHEGNILNDSKLAIALKQIFIQAVSAREHCIPAGTQCLFTVFNNMLEKGLSHGVKPPAEVKGDYFF